MEIQKLLHWKARYVCDRIMSLGFTYKIDKLDNRLNTKEQAP